MTKAPTPTEKSKEQSDNSHKNFDYTTIADPLRTVSCDYENVNLTGVV